MNDTTKLDKLIRVIEAKIARLVIEKANLEWHNVCGPPMAMVCHPLRELQWVLQELKEL
jgi:hypothetical protein